MIKSNIKILNSYKNQYLKKFKLKRILLRLSYLLKTGVHLDTKLQEHYTPMPYIIGFRHNILIIDLIQNILKRKRCYTLRLYLLKKKFQIIKKKIVNENNLLVYIYVYVLIIILNIYNSNFNIDFLILTVSWSFGAIIFFAVVFYQYSNTSIKNLKQFYIFILYLLYWSVLGAIDPQCVIFKMFNLFNILILSPLFNNNWFTIFISKYRIFIIGIVLAYLFFKINPILFFKIDLNLLLYGDIFLVSSSFFIMKLIGKIGGYISETNVVKAVGILTLGYVSVETIHDVTSVLKHTQPVIKKTYVFKKTVETTSKKTFLTENKSEKITTELIELTPQEHAELHDSLLREISLDN